MPKTLAAGALALALIAPGPLSSALLSSALLLSVPVSSALAAPEPDDAKKRTSWGLYLTAREAYEMKRERGAAVLFVDVREPVEIMFTGFTDAVDVNVPFLLVDPAEWNAKKSVFMMEPNPDFAAGILAALEARGLDGTAPVILMCRSGGTRGAPSAKALEGLGLTQVYVVVDGFEGATAKDNPNGPWRLVDGWKNSGLPWGYVLDPEKIYRRSFD